MTATANIDGLLNQVTESQAARQRKSDEDFRRLAHEIAIGKNPTPERVEKTISAAGKNVDDLRLVVEGHLQRIADVGIVKSSSGLAAKLEEAMKQAADNDAERDAAILKWEQSKAPIQERIAQVEASQRDAETARNRLISTAPADLVAEYRALALRKQELGRRVSAMRVDLSRRGGVIEERKQQVTKATGGGRRNSASEQATGDEVAQWQREIEEWTALAEKADVELPGTEKQLAGLEQDESRLIERMLQP